MLVCLLLGKSTGILDNYALNFTEAYLLLCSEGDLSLMTDSVFLVTVLAQKDHKFSKRIYNFIKVKFTSLFMIYKLFTFYRL